MKVLILLFGLIITGHVHAWGLKEFGEEAAVPVTTEAKYVLIAGTAVTVALVILEDQVVDPFQQETVEDKRLGQSSKWGDWLGQLVPNAIYIGGMSIAGANGNEEGYRRALGMFKATAYSTSVSTILKYTVRERRPTDPNWKTSFPSGHTTSAFSFSGYVAAEHGWAWGLPATLLSAFVGYSRVNDNKHWIHDVTAGATIGWVYGWGISKYQRKNKTDEETAFVAPILDSQTAGLAFYREF